MSFLMAFYMLWDVLWPLILGFALSGVVQAVVSHAKMAETLGDDSPKSVTLATLFGIASSSCSYAAIALARSIFRKGASFSNAMVFELSSTNLVIELGVILWVFMGWQFVAAEFTGGIIMVILLALIFRFTLSRKLVKEARRQAEKNVMGKMEGHAGMDMSLTEGTIWSRLLSKKGFTAISHFFIMDVASIWTDILIGFGIAGILAVFVPESFWQAFFFTNHPTLAYIEGPLVGPLVAMLSFVCSVGNIPLAAVLWKGGISFGGVVSFIFADLIVLPILNIYRKYYGWKMMAYILVTFYATMAAAGYIIEFLFAVLHIIPTNRNVVMISSGISWNYTSILNIAFLLIAGILTIRFLRTGGPAMLKMMEMDPKDMKDCCKV
ncbi:MAG TPA: permease [Patescibacteria group bacterium]|nr:permease [Patescibacteria group bacterium]